MQAPAVDVPDRSVRTTAVKAMIKIFDELGRVSAMNWRDGLNCVQGLLRRTAGLGGNVSLTVENMPPERSLHGSCVAYEEFAGICRH